MSDRIASLLLAVLSIALLAANVAVKPGFDPDEVRAFAGTFGASREWQGRTAPDFELALRDGSTFRLADRVGREVVVLNFFATWCVPCRTEMPELQRFVDQMNDANQPITLVAIDAREQPDQVDRFIADLKLRMAVAIDADGEIMKRYGVTAFPTTVVVGADGRIKLYTEGAISNADVAFNPVVASEFMVLANGRGISREAYLAELAATPPTAPAPAPDTEMAELFGRARSIAEAMPCPCGCSDRVIACSCQTAKGIKRRLNEGVEASLTDAEVMERLNKEFCMKGM